MKGRAGDEGVGLCCPGRAGILTSTLVSLMGQARIYVVLGRERLLPPGLAAVHAERKTPVNATMLTALSGGGPSVLLLHPTA